MNPSKTEIQIITGSNGESRIFRDYDEFKKWFEQEREAWGWLNHQHCHSTSQFAGYFQYTTNKINHIDSVNNPKVVESEFDELINHVSSTYLTKQVIPTDSPEGAFVLELRKTEPMIAMGALDFFMGKPIAQLDENIGKRIKGFLFANSFRIGDRNNEEEKRYLEKLAKEFSTNSNVLFTKINGLIAETEEKVENNQNSVNEHTARLTKLIEVARNQTTECVEELNKRAQEIERVYKEKVQLKAPVKYFEDQNSLHESGSISSFRWFMGSSVGFMILFIVLVKLIFGITDLVQIEKYLILATFFTFGTWAVRTNYRNYLNHQHLKTVAGEKGVLVKVYLSLLENDKNLNENDRGVILSSLFKVPQNIFAKDDGGSGSPVEILLRSIQK